ncbi:MAG: T9SS type A sorting domain-containing protein [Bacteroidia bacterium]
MKKQLLTFIVASILGIFTTAQAQMTPGCIAPDFIATDIDGTQWHLYDILATGKPVYIDVSATWCGPCWNYHNSGALEDLYNTYGPQGTNELMVFFIEGDDNTTNADLHGTGTNTQGDWVTGTPYPIIDNGTIANDLEISYFPTIYLICPDHIIREIGQLTTSAQLYAQRTTCPIANQANADDAGLTNSNVCLNTNLASCTSVDIACRIANYGTSPLTSATITLSVGGTVQQTAQWTGTLNTYESDVYTFTGVTGVTGTNSVSIVVSSPNGNTDPTSANNTRTSSFLIYPQVGGPEVTEAYASAAFPPTNWNIINGGDAVTWTRSTAGLNGAGSAKMDFYNSPSGDVDALQLPAMDLSGLQDASLTFDLSHARYQTSNDNLKIKVSADCGGTWTTVFNKTGAALATTTASTTAFTPTTAAQWRSELVSLGAFVGNNNLFVKFEGLSNYGNNLYVDNVNVTFSTGITTVTKKVAFELYPNPASDRASVDVNLDKKDDVTIEVFNKVGALVYSSTEAGMSAGEHSITINTNDFAKGVYMVSVKTSMGASQKKLVVE